MSFSRYYRENRTRFILDALTGVALVPVFWVLAVAFLSMGDM